jgi:hypothetical protein
MGKKYFSILLLILIISIPINIFGIINTMVSLKYETDSPGECISGMTGTDLCTSIRYMKISVAVAVVLTAILLFFKNKIVKTNV